MQPTFCQVYSWCGPRDAAGSTDHAWIKGWDASDRRFEVSCKLLNFEELNSYEFDYMPNFGRRQCASNTLKLRNLLGFLYCRLRCLGRRGSGVQIAPPRPNPLFSVFSLLKQASVKG